MPQAVEWNKVKSEELGPGIIRQYVNGGGTTLARFQLTKGSVVGLHHHINRQITNVLSGALLFKMSGKEFVVGAGECLFIEPNEPHEVVTMEDAVVFDVFIPERADWNAGQSNYFAKK